MASATLLLWDGVFEADTNMAKDAQLLEDAQQGLPGARVYRWVRPSVSLGMFQSPHLDLLPSCPLPWVMRPTGGRAVLHGHDETVGLAVPLQALGVDSRSVRAAYRAVIAPLLHALRSCGVSVELGENTRFLKPSGSARPARLAADCFAHVSANDLVDPDSGLKVCGCALRLTDKAVLVQASIPNGLPLVDPQTVFAMPSAHVAKRWNAEGFPDELGKALLESGWFSSETWACDRGRFGQAHFPTLSKP